MNNSMIVKFYSLARTAKLVSRISLLGGFLCLSMAAVFSSTVSEAAEEQINYADNPEVQGFISDMVKKHGMSRSWLENLMLEIEHKPRILELIARPAEKRLEWKEYREIFLKPRRINQGVDFWRENKNELQRATKQYGVPKEIIVAIIGVETYYGGNMGGFRAMDALATLGFYYPPRAKFFRKEFEQLLLLAREQGINPFNFMGSYAGAIGYGQFIPSSYRNFAVDYDGDGVVRLWNSKADAIGSVANYLKTNGWSKSPLIAVRANMLSQHDASFINDSLRPRHRVEVLKQAGFIPRQELENSHKAAIHRLIASDGTEYWYGLQNFYAITRYNISRLYAMAVYQLANKIKVAVDDEKI